VVKSAETAVASPPHALRERDAFVLLVAAVFFAGMASLVYEVVWIRQLGLSLGSTAVAFSVMLSAFLGGLALGGWYMGKRADAAPAPFLLLARIELAAAALGVLAIPVLAAVGRAYVLIAVTVSGEPWISLALRSIVALLVMLVPATLFGMTFPLATAAGGRLVAGETSVGVISAASSFGSAVGALLCGLWFEPAFGLFVSAAIGAGFNLVAAGAAYWVHLRQP
jgi:spermidine synthase